jgi:hypothetical protein
MVFTASPRITNRMSADFRTVQLPGSVNVKMTKTTPAKIDHAALIVLLIAPPPHITVLQPR